jgi:hypothetical protein
MTRRLRQQKSGCGSSAENAAPDQTAPELQNHRQSLGRNGFGCLAGRDAYAAAMLVLAATTWEKLQNVPVRFWVNLLLALATGVVAVLLARYAAKMNRLLLTLIVFLLITVVGFQWIYERNEPKFMTSTIDKIAPYFPSKVRYRGND